MSGYLLIFGLALPALLVQLALQGRWHEAAVRRRWSFSMPGVYASILHDGLADLRAHRDLARFALERAAAAPRSSPAVLAVYCTRATTALVDARREARLLPQLEPIEPARAKRLHAPVLRGAAAAGAAAHHLTVTTGERWRMRAHVLAWCVRLMPVALAWVIWRRRWGALPGLQADLDAVQAEIERQVESLMRSAGALAK